MKTKFSFFAFLSLIVFSSCHFFHSFNEVEEDVKSMEFDKNVLEMSIGEMEMLNLSINSKSGQNKLNVEWVYDTSIIKAQGDSYGIVITALKEGTATIQAKCDGKSVSCALRVLNNGVVAKIENPYVYCSSDIINITPNETKKVFASLYGGTNADINGFSFVSDKPSIASLYTEGNYCWITGMNEGMAKITVRHSKSSFGYSFLVNCTASQTNVPYITTDTNIITINRSTDSVSKKIKVDLMNSLYPTYKDDFVFDVVDSSGNVMSNPPVSLDYSANECTVTALETVNCFIRVTHPSSVYSLEILCRIVENIDIVYIQPSSSYIVINGESSETLELNLEGLAPGVSVDYDRFLWDFSEGAENIIDWNIHGGSENGKGNLVWLTGKKNGSVKLTVSHPLSSNSRSVIITVHNAVQDASSSKIYITTLQNYIETKEGDENTRLDITLTNIQSGEENNLEWHIENDAKDGSTDPVIMFSGCTGVSYSKPKGRSAALTASAFGHAYITPLKEGSAVITITHPKAAYPTKVFVSVLAADSQKVIPLSLSANEVYYTIQKGETQQLDVVLTNEKEGDVSSLIWTCDNPTFTLNPNGTSCFITPSSDNLENAVVTVSSPNALYPVNYTVISYCEAEQLVNLKTLYSNKTVYTLTGGESCVLQVEGIGFGENDSVIWDITNNNGGSVSLSEQNTIRNNDKIVSGINVNIAEASSSGVAEITANIPSFNKNVVFYINIKQKGIVDETKPAYLTTTQNVVTVNLNETEEVYVLPVNIQASDYERIEWNNDSPDVFEIIPNGKSATIMPLKEGNGTITCSHPLITNTLTINVHVGNEYVFKNTDVAYISTENDVLLIKKDSQDVMFNAVLAHTESDLIETTGFDFFSKNENIFTVNYISGNNYCIITPVKSGQAILQISHPKAEYNKEVLVIIEKSVAELSDITYLSTNQNVVTVVQGQFTTVSVSLNNAQQYDSSKFSWSSQNGNISDVVTNNGNTAMLSGVTPGTTKLVVTHSNCLYQLEIIVICLDSEIVTSNPFVQSNTNILSLKTGTSQTITSKMVGGNDSDSAGFIWTVSDSSIALISGAGSSCYVRGLKKGTTYITVRNINYPDSYAKSILVRVEDTTDDECYITLSQQILKLNPKNKNGENITAKLENGTPTDAQSFVWWADDYSVINIDSITDTVSIVPTGVSGTTYVHVKHPKCLNSADILVICSEYDEFSFIEPSKKILDKSITFMNMCVPVSEGDTWIEYESSNTDVCVATGSNKVCMLAGIRQGSAKITATLKNVKGIIAESELAVIVEKRAADINTISMESTILNMNVGDSQTLEAFLNGNSVNELDVYSIKWEVEETSENKGVVELLKTEQGLTMGKNAYITAKKPGTAILKITHPKCENYPLTVWVVVPEKEVPVVTLDQTYLEIYKGDGSATITAKVTNGTKEDENNIIWTAPKVGGVNIITISTNKGKSCNIVPRNTGSTTLRAQLPNGIYADCVVTVLTNAELKLESKVVRVNPGYRETIKYYITPESAIVDWLEMMNETDGYGEQKDCFDFEINPTTKTITIIGKELGSGYLYGYFASDNGTASAKLDIKCEYNYELEFEENGLSRTMPKNGTIEEYDFHVYPRNLEINCQSNCDYLEIVSYSLDEQTGKGKVYVKPVKEGHGGKITITATNPDDLNNTPINRTHYIDSYYDNVHITPVFITDERSFSNYSGGILTLGDGESVTFYLKCDEENADISNVTVQYAPAKGYENRVDCNSNIICSKDTSTTQNNLPIFTIKHKDDYVSDEKYVFVSKHYDIWANGWDGFWCDIEYDTSLYDWKCHNDFDLYPTFKLDGKKYSIHKNFHYCKTGVSGIYRKLRMDWLNGESMSLSELTNKFKAALLSSNHVINCAYVIPKSTFHYDYYVLPDHEYFYYGGGNSWDKDATVYFTNNILHPWYEGETECKDDNEIESKGGYGKISISYSRNNSPYILNPITVKVEVRACRKNQKGVWVKDRVNGDLCYRLADSGGLSQLENTYNQRNDLYAFYENTNIQLDTNNNNNITLNLKTNITNPDISYVVSDANICSVNKSGNSLIINSKSEGDTKISGTVKYNNSIVSSFSISVKVSNNCIYLNPFLVEEKESSYYTIKNLIFDAGTSLSKNDSGRVYYSIPLPNPYTLPQEQKTIQPVYSNSTLDWSKLVFEYDSSKLDVINNNDSTFVVKTKTEQYIPTADCFENLNLYISWLDYYGVEWEYADEENTSVTVLGDVPLMNRIKKGDFVIKVKHPDCPDDNILTYNVSVIGGLFD